ncbi:MAG: ferric reductase-like transmembrane domain-containing protein [candidate division WOR-3 bacterium]
MFLSLRTDLNFEAKLRLSLGDSAFILLIAALAIGPLSKLWNFFSVLIPWRREIGTWSAILAMTHFLVVFDFAFNEPGLKLANLLGLIALFWMIVLALTSSDLAVNYLGVSSWKWLHQFAYVIFYLSSAHVIYHLFWYYPEKIWLSWAFLTMILAIPILQISAFIKIVLRQRKLLTLEDKAKTPKSGFIKLPIVKQKKIAEETYEVSFDVSGVNFPFKAGQYIELNLPKLNYQDPKGAFRTFSLASSPNDKTKISVAFRNTGSGFKKTLLELPKGSLVEIRGPFGYFVLPKDENKEIIFIAGGIGITPCLSMIRYSGENKLKNKITLLYANRNEQAAAYLDELKQWQLKNPNFILINKFGRIDEDFIKKSVKNLESPLWYIVGPPPMVAATRDILSNLKVKDENIMTEDFIGY